MSDSDRSRLFDLAAAAADGVPLDWDREVERSGDSGEREVVRSLGVLASVLSAHQTLRDSPPRIPIRRFPWPWGPLTVVEEVGHGSFGTVFRAHDPEEPLLAIHIPLRFFSRKPRRDIGQHHYRELEALGRMHCH